MEEVMTMKDPLGDRMKGYEYRTRTLLPRRTYTIMRLDGRNFSRFTRNMERPFDAGLAHFMNCTAEMLGKEVGGSVFTYTQSDEISILLQDFESLNTQPWCDGNIQKMTSIAAGMASVYFHSIQDIQAGGVWKHGFDARVYTISDPVEVANYFLWRQRDCVKNSITMAARTQFSDMQLLGKNGSERQEMLFSKGINWNDYQAGFKRGRVGIREFFELESEEHGTTTRTCWKSEPAPHFTANVGDWLATNIPALPSLKEK